MIAYDPVVPPIYYDTETCGLHGPITLIQYAIGDGPVVLHEPWREPIIETIKLIEMICSHPGGVVGFNLAFDHFHLCQMYTTLALMSDLNADLEDCIDEYARKEPLGRDGPCLKPVLSHDVMLFARKGPYQSTMERGDIRIRRVPTQLAWLLAKELEKRVTLSDVYFAKRKDKFGAKWKVFDLEDADGDPIDDFKDVVLNFAPSAALKVLAADALKLKPDAILLFADIEPKIYPEEIGYAPFALAVGKPGRWKGAWPDVIKHHIEHWGYHKLARQYAEKDVVLTRALYQHFGSQPLGDDDSELACMVGAVRWRGFSIDVDGIKDLKREANQRITKVPTHKDYVKKYINAVLTPEDKLVMKTSTKKVLLEELSKRTNEPCEACEGHGKVSASGITVSQDSIHEDGHREKRFISGDLVTCKQCQGKGTYAHPVAARAKAVLDARQAKYEIDFYNKLLLAGRLHASFNVIGALSSRMSGTDGLNSQGIKHDPAVRCKFPLKWPGTILSGGDFAGFEVVIAEATYGDPDLRKDLLTKRPCHVCTCCKPELSTIAAGCKCEGKGEFWKKKKDKLVREWCVCTARKNAPRCEECNDEGVIHRDTPEQTWCPHCLDYRPKPGCDDCWGTGLALTKIHALFGMFLYPGMSYEDLLADKEKYTRSKSGVFLKMYGGEAFTMVERLGIDQEVAEQADARFMNRYQGVKRSQERIEKMFQTMNQKGGLGTKITYHEAADYVEAGFGFRRYFTLENRIVKALVELAQTPPPGWKEMKVKVTRRDREQTGMGATQSALYGAAFALQASNKRAAANHEIQSYGAQITKLVQRKVWDLQPTGIGAWLVTPMNVHDEILSVTDPSMVERVKETVDAAVESVRPRVPLIEMNWKKEMQSWAEK